MVCTELYGCSLKLKLFSIPFFDPYKKPNGGNICRVNAPNNDFPYGKFPAGKIGGGAGGRKYLACKASCRQDAASQSLLRRVSAVPSPGHKKS